MSKIIKKKSFCSLYLITFFIFCSLFISIEAFSRKHWNRDYMQVSWQSDGNYILISFEVFDYDFGPLYENAYLERCNFQYSTDGVNYLHLMNANTKDQKSINKSFTWVYMSQKLTGVHLVFGNCNTPKGGTVWAENEDYNVEVFNSVYGYQAWPNILWYVGETYNDVKYIRITGKWHVNGVWPNEFFENIVYPTDIPGVLASTKTFKNNALKVIKKEDAVVVKGVEHGENIQVYTTSGIQINSIVANNNIVKINLPVKNIYIIHIGQSCHKVAL